MQGKALEHSTIELHLPPTPFQSPRQTLPAGGHYSAQESLTPSLNPVSYVFKAGSHSPGWTVPPHAVEDNFVFLDLPLTPSLTLCWELNLGLEC